MGATRGGMTDEDSRKLVERVAASRYLSKSARLRDLLIYLCDRVLDGSVTEIHEQEVGHKVFGRPADYDTGSDNIVRVHASTLRKRLEQYFAEEGAAEPLIIEIPKGNYAPVFRRRTPAEAVAPPPELPPPARDWRVPVLGVLACLFAISTAVLLVRGAKPDRRESADLGPTVRTFWAQVFRPGQTTDAVVDDASVGLYQELSGRTITLSEYFDRSYLRAVPSGAAAANLDEQSANAIVLRRQSSFATVSFLSKLLSIAGPQSREIVVVFARDYSFRGLKGDNAVLLGNARSNPWIEPFLPRLGVRWIFDKAQGTYYPVDTWAAGEPKTYRAADGDTRESYCGISLLPNLGGNGTVLIVSATGGSAFNAAGAFLSDEEAMASLRKRLGGDQAAFENFEALIRVKGRSAQPRDATVVICRPVRP
jgi:hypothetical protein